MAYPKLIDVKPLSGHRLLLLYEGEQRIYDFSPNLNHKFYRQLENPTLFGHVAVIDGGIEWGTGQDFCPHTLYEQSVPAPIGQSQR